MASAATTRVRHEGMAECEQCDRLHPDSTRERCRIHVNQTGHTVRFVIEDVTVYKPPAITKGSAG